MNLNHQEIEPANYWDMTEPLVEKHHRDVEDGDLIEKQYTDEDCIVLWPRVGTRKRRAGDAIDTSIAPSASVICNGSAKKQRQGQG